MKKRMFRRMLSAILVCFAIFQIPVPVHADDSNNPQTTAISTLDKYNIELLIDKSGSMNGTDKEGLAKSAACQFIDQMSTLSNDILDLSAATSVGVMSFSRETSVITPITSLDNATNADYLKAEISRIKYDPAGTGGTDLSVAVYDALRQLEKVSENDQKNMIVLFTDGYSEAVKDAGVSAESLKKAFALADELNCQFYVVGLNYKDKIKDAGRQEIYRLANTVQHEEGISTKESDDTSASFQNTNYLITSNIGDVREFYGKIYAKMIGSEFHYLDNSKFYVDSTGIIEADVTVYSNSKINGVTVTDPDGNHMIEDGRSFFVSGDDYYKVIKIMKPLPGEWTVNVVSEDDKYKSYVIQFYGVQISAVAEWDIGSAFSESGLMTPFVGRVTVIPMFKGTPYIDDALADASTVAQFVATKGGVSETYSMSYTNGKFVGYFPVEQGNYEIEAHLVNDTLDRTVKCKLAVTNPKGEIEVDLRKIDIKESQTVDVDLLSKTGASHLTVLEIRQSDGSEQFATIDCTNTDGRVAISVTGVESGESEFSILAQDLYGIRYIITGTVVVSFQLMWYHWLWVLLGVGLIVLIALLIWNAFRRIPGNFYVTVEMINREKGNVGTIVEQTIVSPAGKRFSLWRLALVVKIYIDNLRSDSDISAEKEMAELLLSEKKMISRNKICMGKNIRKKNIYKLKTKKGDRDLTSEIEAYKSSELSIRVSFESLFAGEEDEMSDEDWGRATDFKKNKKSRGRRSSSDFGNED